MRIRLLVLLLFNQLALVEAQTNGIRYHYDDLNRLTHIEYATGQVVQFTYDEVGNRLSYTISLYTVTCTVTIPPGDPPPIDIPCARLTLDFSSGPGGEVTVQEILSSPPRGARSKAVLSPTKPSKKFLDASEDIQVATSANDTLIAIERYWEISSNMRDGTYACLMRIGYDTKEFSEELTEQNLGIFHFDANASAYVELPTLPDQVHDSVRTASAFDRLGRFVLGARVPRNVSIAYDFTASSKGCYLVSVPLTADSLVSKLFPDAEGSIAHVWDSSRERFDAVTKVEQEKGYWISIPRKMNHVITGVPVTSYVAKFTSIGWHMIGSVASQVDFSDPQDIPDSSVVAAFGWNPVEQTYSRTTTLEPGKGYWIAVAQKCELTVGSTSPISDARTAQSTSWEVFAARFGDTPPEPPCMPTSVKNPSLQSMPPEFSLSQNYPNPFNPATQIDYGLPRGAFVRLEVYNALGQKVRTLVAEAKAAGYHSILWQGTNDFGQSVPSGIYFIRIKAGTFLSVRKILFLN